MHISPAVNDVKLITGSAPNYEKAKNQTPYAGNSKTGQRVSDEFGIAKEINKQVKKAAKPRMKDFARQVKDAIGDKITSTEITLFEENHFHIAKLGSIAKAEEEAVEQFIETGHDAEDETLGNVVAAAGYASQGLSQSDASEAQKQAHYIANEARKAARAVTVIGDQVKHAEGFLENRRKKKKDQEESQKD